jgi:hypothetical protein
MLVTCEFCGWRYLHHREKVHKVIHALLSPWPCYLPFSLPMGMEATQFPLNVVAVLLHGIFCNLQPELPVRLFILRFVSKDPLSVLIFTVVES